MTNKYVPQSTATKEVAELLSQDINIRQNCIQQIEEILASKDTESEKNRKIDLECKRLCEFEFRKVESASLRKSKFAHLGANSSKHQHNDVCRLINNIRNGSCYWELAEQFDKNAEAFVMKLEGRLALHLAGGILENANICLHPHFNCPYLPGSGLKGVASHAAWSKWNESKSLDDALKVAWTFGYPTGDSMPKKMEQRTRSENEYLDNFLANQKPEWFGEKGEFKTFAGLASFLPAFPLEDNFKATVDVLTCHHPKYYRGEKEKATDDESPNPQFFPVLESGSKFRFVIRPVHNANWPEELSNEAILKWAKAFLVEGLELYGAGAKTAAGYGWFSLDEDAEELRKKARYNRRIKKELSDAVEKLKTTNVESLTKAEFDAFKKAFDQLDKKAASEKIELPKKQVLIDGFGRLKKLLPQETPIDELRGKWESQNSKAIINGPMIKGFEKQKPDQKTLIVELLCEDSGIGAEIWREIKQGQKDQLQMR